MKSSKQIRHQRIKEIIKTYDDLTQGALQQKLEADYQIKVDRSIISKDLKELSIPKNKKTKALEFSPEAAAKDLQLQIFHLLVSVPSESAYHIIQKEDDNLTMIIFYTEPRTAVAVAVLLEQLFEVRYDPFVAIANHSGKILLIFPLKYKQAIHDELDIIMEGNML